MHHISFTKFSKSRQFWKLILWMIFITSLVYLPIFINPHLLLARNNDLQEQFWPIFYFIKQQILLYHTVPLWNNLFFSGMPLLPDPQFSLFYLPNWLFILLPTDLAFITLFYLHTLASGIFVYLLAKRVFNIPNRACLFSALLYVVSPRLAGYLEAGHYGLVITLAWIPLTTLSVIKLAEKPKAVWAIILAVSLSGLFFTHTVTFFWAIIASCFWMLVTLVLNKPFKSWFKPTLFFILSGVITLGLTAVTLLPQLEWAPQTTRLLLLHDRDVYPKWTSFLEFIKAVIAPWSLPGGIWSADTEKWLVLGITPIILAIIGWWGLKLKIKITLFLLSIPIVLISLNNASPLYNFLLGQNWYLLMRVSTRLWFIPLIFVVLLAGRGFYQIEKRLLKYKLIGKIIAVIIITIPIVELLVTSWLLIYKPVPVPTNKVPVELYQFLENDPSQFRVFCLDRCLLQQDVALYNLETIEGYNTLQQMNYYKHFWQLSGGYWNYYTLALPPMGPQKIHPDLTSLGLYNTKYIISPIPLNDTHAVLEKQFGNYYLYRNLLVKPRSYFWSHNQAGAEVNILKYTANYILLDTSSLQGNSLILAEVYSPGWNAYLNGKTKVSVQETPNALRLIDIATGTDFVEFKYEPAAFKTGFIITSVTLILIITYFTRYFIASVIIRVLKKL